MTFVIFPYVPQCSLECSFQLCYFLLDNQHMRRCIAKGVYERRSYRYLCKLTSHKHTKKHELLICGSHNFVQHI
jgi:hypothetical protein